MIYAADRSGEGRCMNRCELRSSAAFAAAAVLAVALSVNKAAASDLAPPPPPPMVSSEPAAIIFGPPTLYHPERFEIRGGVFAHAIGSPEAGSADLNLELVAPRFFTIPFLPDYLTPRFHVAGIGHLAGRTSYVYARGLSMFNFTPRWFAEGFFGGIVHNGELRDVAAAMDGLG